MNLVELRSNLTGEPLPVEITTSSGETLLVRYLLKPGCRRYVMRLKGDRVQVTLPHHYSATQVKSFLAKNIRWIDQQLHQQQTRPSLTDTFGVGSKMLFRGDWVEVLAKKEGEVEWAGMVFAATENPVKLKHAIYHHLYQLAWNELPALTHAYADQQGLKVSRITIRNQKTRWGSCSAKAAISLNWRLVQTPDLVRDYIIYHELMHLRHMNHSSRYWAAVEKAFPNYKLAEQWLKEHCGLLKS